LVWAKNGRVGLAIRLETQQPAVLRIEIEEKIIANLNKLRRSNAIGRESQYLVGAITVVIDQMLDDSRGTGLVTYPQCQTGKQIRSNRRLEAAQLAPGDNSVIVAVEAYGIVEITQRDVPLPVYLLAVQSETEVAIARFVRRYGRGQAYHYRGGDRGDGHKLLHLAAAVS
jgi:hypothetical protein